MLQAEQLASAKALRQEHTRRAWETVRRPVWLERREQGGNEVREVMRCPVEHWKDLGFDFEKGAMEGCGVTE